MSGVTAGAVGRYLRSHPHPPTRDAGPEFLIHDPAAHAWYVRWPSGKTQWETETSLVMRGLSPARPILESERS